MRLTADDKLRIFLGDASAFFGVVFSIGGAFFAGLVLYGYDLSSFQMACFPLAQTTGRIILVSDTETHVNDSTVIDYTYQYQASGRSYTAHSFSEAQRRPVGAYVAVEYISTKPSYARIRGMRNAPTPFWALLMVPFLLCIGPGILYMSWRRTRRIVALVTSPFITPAICQRLENLDQKDEDGHKIYRAHYHYTVGKHSYTHTLDTTEITEYGVEEPLVAQLDQPKNAKLAKELPDFIWQRLRRQHVR